MGGGAALSDYEEYDSNCFTCARRRNNQCKPPYLQSQQLPFLVPSTRKEAALGRQRSELWTRL